MPLAPQASERKHHRAHVQQRHVLRTGSTNCNLAGGFGWLFLLTCRKLASRPVGLLEASVVTVRFVPSMSSTYQYHKHKETELCERGRRPPILYLRVDLEPLATSDDQRQRSQEKRLGIPDEPPSSTSRQQPRVLSLAGRKEPRRCYRTYRCGPHPLIQHPHEKWRLGASGEELIVTFVD